MTAVEWLVSCITKLEWDLLEKKIDCEEYGRIYRQNIEQAKEMHKQQIIDAYSNGEDNVDNDGCTISKNGAESYFAETYGSKESDEHIVDTNEIIKDINYWKQNCEEEIMTTPISVLRYISELEKLVPTSSQTEISDEEIEQAAKDYHRNNGVYYGQVKAFIDAIKWYREQLKQKI